MKRPGVVLFAAIVACSSARPAEPIAPRRPPVAESAPPPPDAGRTRPDPRALCEGITARSRALRDEALARRRAGYDAALASGELARRRDERVRDATRSIERYLADRKAGVPLPPWATLRTQSDVDELRRKLGELAKIEPYAPPEHDLPSLVGWCAPHATGVWAAPLEAIELAPWDDPFDVGARWAIVHVDLDGRVARFPVNAFASGPSGTRVTDANCCMSPPADAITISEPVLFDFDGDGVPEIFLRSSVEGNEGHREAEPYLLAFHGGVVVRFYRGDVEQLEDVNGDGRPDLVRHSYTEETSGEAGFTRWMQGPREVLLSKPDGSFEPLGEGADGG